MILLFEDGTVGGGHGGGHIDVAGRDMLNLDDYMRAIHLLTEVSPLVFSASSSGNLCIVGGDVGSVVGVALVGAHCATPTVGVGAESEVLFVAVDVGGVTLPVGGHENPVVVVICARAVVVKLHDEAFARRDGDEVGERTPPASRIVSSTDGGAGDLDDGGVAVGVVVLGGGDGVDALKRATQGS